METSPGQNPLGNKQVACVACVFLLTMAASLVWSPDIKSTAAPQSPAPVGIATAPAARPVPFPFPTPARTPVPPAIPAAVILPAIPARPVERPVLNAAQQAVLQQFATFVPQFAAATGIRLVPIRAGTFRMGSPADESGRFGNEGPQTQVTLTKDFFLGATSVTQSQWTAVRGYNPSQFKGDNLPVETVSWTEVMAFCKTLTERERAAGRLPAEWQFTLPTEAQWEYACRAGTTGPVPGELEAIAWYEKNSGGTTHPVGTKQPNAWGLFDMHGNVYAWCLDSQGSYSGGSVTDPVGPSTDPFRVFRGSSWRSDAASTRAAYRSYGQPGSHNNNLGFRLALVLSGTK